MSFHRFIFSLFEMKCNLKGREDDKKELGEIHSRNAAFCKVQ